MYLHMKRFQNPSWYIRLIVHFVFLFLLDNTFGSFRVAALLLVLLCIYKVDGGDSVARDSFRDWFDVLRPVTALSPVGTHL